MLVRDMNALHQQPEVKAIKKVKNQTGEAVKSTFEEQLERLHQQASPGRHPYLSWLRIWIYQTQHIPSFLLIPPLDLGENYEAAWPRPPLPKMDADRHAIGRLLPYI